MEFLFAAQVALRSLHRDVTQEKLDLFQLSTRKVAQTRTCPPEIMGSQVQDSSTPSSAMVWCEEGAHTRAAPSGVYGINAPRVGLLTRPVYWN